MAITEDILPLTVTLETVGRIRCAGESTAGLAAQVGGGKAPFTFEWSTGGSGDQLEQLGQGQYSVTVTDAMGTTQTAQGQIPAPQALELSTQAIQSASTDGTDGRARVQVAGGTGPFTYAWDSNESGAEAQQLAPGLHTVTVTDANGCTASAEVAITEDILPLEVDILVDQEISCDTFTVGRLKAQVAGGKGPFTYQWNDDKGQGETLAGLSAGQYALTVTDVSGQSAQARFRLNAPDPLKIQLVNVERSGGNDGAASVRIEGGTQPYTIRWDNGESGPQAQALSPGEHLVRVSDDRSCEAVAEFTIEERLIPDLKTEELEVDKRIQMEALAFQADSTNLNPGMDPVLNELYDFLATNPQVKVEIGGHTNSLPPDSYCDRLSNARAKAVADYLIERGIPAGRVSYKGYGKRDPIASNETPEGRRKNQRVEVKILALE